jgi:hypothetical protein
VCVQCLDEEGMQVLACSREAVGSFYPEKKSEFAVYGRRVNSFVLVCSLSSHRHFFIPLIFGSRFIDS